MGGSPLSHDPKIQVHYTLYLCQPNIWPPCPNGRKKERTAHERFSILSLKVMPTFHCLEESLGLHLTVRKARKCCLYVHKEEKNGNW